MMLPLSRRRLLGPGILIALLLVVGVLAAISTDQQHSAQAPTLIPDYDVHSSGPAGTRALSLWLSDLGYQTRTLEYEPFRLRDDDRLLFMLFPSLDPTEQQITEIDQWVSRGGTLVIAARESDSLLDHFGVTVSPHFPENVSARPLQPLLLNPPPGPVSVDTYGSLHLLDSAWVPLLGGSSVASVIAASLAHGTGRVIVLSTGDPFSNAGLQQSGDAALALNLLSGVPAGGGVVIDEYHHGFTEQGTLTYRLVHDPWGWAILYLAVMLFLYLAFGGRRFGPIAKPYVQGTRRARAEYATTLAALLQQGGHREWLRTQYVAQLKRKLGTRFHLWSTDSTAGFLEQLIARAPEATALLDPLEQLEAARVPDERTLVALIREVEDVATRLIDQRKPVETNAGRQ
ncbi:MAG TPA: DUF4350 domain-containing protein [Nitrolancea sp.]|jgi:hypothetical protein|nr:DUF4350 domain-containing protein [Nitrolancea sp.]